MKIALISSSPWITDRGSRLISALLKRAGHSVKLLFMAKTRNYPMDEIERLHEIIKDVDMVMIAVYSAYAIRAMDITDFVHKKYPGMKVIWGGPHCIAASEHCLKYADGICYCEGDECVVEFVNKFEKGDPAYLDTPSMAFNVNGTMKINKVLPPFSNLDNLPYSDLDIANQFILDGDVLPITVDIAKNHFMKFPYDRPVLWNLTARGCPHQCSYCNNCRYITLFGKNTIRMQSVSRFMDEMEHNLKLLPFFERIGIGDDDFLARPKSQIEEFAARYKKNINLPFMIAMSSNTFNKEKFEIILDAGLRTIDMGVQSASQRVLDEVFNRNIKTAKNKQAAQTMEPYIEKYKLELILDFIYDNPYETKADIMESYNFLSDLSPLVRVNLFQLAFFPGTPIYDRALKDGLIKPFDTDFRFAAIDRIIKIKYKKNYETLLLFVVGMLRKKLNISRTVLKILGSRPMRAIASVLPGVFYAGIFKHLQKLR